MDKELHTIGHSNHTIGAFLERLNQHDIDVVCDVRSAPYSRYNPQFNRETLAEALKRAAIKYVFLGTELGARSDDPQCYENGKVKYERLAHTELFQAGLKRLRNGIEKHRVAIMCAEKDPLMCHRTILVCRQLKGDELDIKHILADGMLEHQIHTEERLLHSFKLQPSLLESYDEVLARAYALQEAKIAYVIPSSESDPEFEESAA